MASINWRRRAGAVRRPSRRRRSHLHVICMCRLRPTPFRSDGSKTPISLPKKSHHQNEKKMCCYQSQFDSYTATGNRFFVNEFEYRKEKETLETPFGSYSRSQRDQELIEKEDILRFLFQTKSKIWGNKIARNTKSIWNFGPPTDSVKEKPVKSGLEPVRDGLPVPKFTAPCTRFYWHIESRYPLPFLSTLVERLTWHMAK